MRNAFARIRSAVDDDAVTALREIEFFRHHSRSEQQFPEQRLIGIRRLSQPPNAVLRNDEHVHRRLRIDIMKGEHVVVFVNDFRRNFAANDFLENGHAVRAFDLLQRTVQLRWDRPESRAFPG